MATRIGLDQNVEAALAYLLVFITGILFYVLEDNAFVRVHAIQSIIVFGTLFLTSMVLGVLSTVLFPFSTAGRFLAGFLATVSILLAPVSLVLWVYLMYRAYAGDRYLFPLTANYVDGTSRTLRTVLKHGT